MPDGTAIQPTGKPFDVIYSTAARWRDGKIIEEYLWSENRAFGGQAAAAGGAERRRLSRWGLLAGGGQGRVGVGGQGFDGDFVAEAFQALEVVAGLAAGTGALVVVAGAEVVVAGGEVR